MTNPIQSAASLIASVTGKTSTQATTTPPASTTANTNSASAQQSQFLLMLTTQLKNQDPMNPMDNAAITTQMAQLSTVEGIQQLNTTLQSLTDSMQTASAASLIGQGVLVPGSSLSLASSKAIAGVTLAGPADSVSVAIKDSKGNTVQTLQLGAQKAGGVVPFTWDGTTSTGTTAPDGSYTFTAQATTSGVTSTPTTLSYGTVNAVTPGTSGATVNVGTLGGFALSAIQQVL